METELEAKLGDSLLSACLEGRLEDVVALLDRHRASNPDLLSLLPVMMEAAASNHQTAISRYCLSQGGRVINSTMIMMVAAHDLGIYKLLVTSKEVDIDYLVPWYGDVLGNVCSCGNVEWARFCLESGANPNTNLVDGYKSVLGAAAEEGSIEIVTLLLEHGAWLQESGAVVLAAVAGKLEIVEFLLDRGAEIDEVGVEDPIDPRTLKDVGSALHKAIDGRYEEMVKLLLDRGAKIDLEDGQGRTALRLAEAKNSTKIAELLKYHGAEN
ncbi:hypothetical protein MMC20_002069 [Loxospora ochrophaea]|nr:hypothetical protein [Loxospora ochrophaea]